MIYEYRVYEPHPGKMDALHARFRDHTLKLFEKHGIKNVGYWTAGGDEHSNRLIYLLGFEDTGHWERAWAAFGSDPEWLRVVKESEADGPLVARVFNTLLTPTDYSPAQ